MKRGIKVEKYLYVPPKTTMITWEGVPTKRGQNSKPVDKHPWFAPIHTKSMDNSIKSGFVPGKRKPPGI